MLKSINVEMTRDGLRLVLGAPGDRGLLFYPGLPEPSRPEITFWGAFFVEPGKRILVVYDKRYTLSIEGEKFFLSDDEDAILHSAVISKPYFAPQS